MPTGDVVQESQQMLGWVLLLRERIVSSLQHGTKQCNRNGAMGRLHNLLMHSHALEIHTCAHVTLRHTFALMHIHRFTILLVLHRLINSLTYSQTLTGYSLGLLFTVWCKYLFQAPWTRRWVERPEKRSSGEMFKSGICRFNN